MALPFSRKRDAIRLTLSVDERRLLGSLLEQLVAVLQEADHEDPAVMRLLPDAYRNDPEAASEFRRLTADDLTEGKVENAKAVIASLAIDKRTPLGQEALQAWLRSLTDLRLTLAARLGVTDDGFPPAADPQVLAMRDVYEWLGYVQESLVQALDR